MIPTLHSGQDVLSFNWAYLGRKPKVGEIVIVKSEKLKVKSEIIKRVERVEGDRVYLIGDNKEESTDSRNFGPVGKDKIIGKVIYIDSHFRGNDMAECPACGGPVIGVYGRKDAICQNCGFKLACCGEP